MHVSMSENKASDKCYAKSTSSQNIDALAPDLGRSHRILNSNKCPLLTFDFFANSRWKKITKELKLKLKL